MNLTRRITHLFLLLMSLTLSHSVLAKTSGHELQQLTADNLPQFVSQISADYYHQLQSLVDYYQLYQQKRDPRGFNVWHLRGFRPAFTTQNNYYQQLTNNAEALKGQPAAELPAAFDAVGKIATQLMVSFRENDPAAYQQAEDLMAENNALVASQLEQYQLSDEIRNISFD